MEMKTYRRYTKPVTEKDLWKFSDMKPTTVSGRATYVRKEPGWLSMKFNDNRWYLRQDDVVKEAAKHLAGKDQIEVTYWYDRHEKRTHVLSFVNHTKNVTVVNQKLHLINAHLQEVKAQREKHHKVINKVVEDGDLFILVKKSPMNTEDQWYDLVDIRGAYGFNTYDTVIDMLHKAGINDVDEWAKRNTPQGDVREIPGHENYLIGAFRTTNKRRDCQCGAHPCENNMQNHSIVVAYLWGWRYLCEYCFFDTMHINVPAKFHKDAVAA
jgi:hypothetical protein